MSVLFSYCFQPYECHFSKFYFFGLSTTKKKTRENSTVLRCPKKKLRKLPFFYPNCSKPSLEHRPRIFLSWKGQLILVPNIKPWPWRGQEMYLKNLALALLWNRSSSKWTTNGPCSWMSSHAARSKSPQLGWTGGKSAHTKQDSQGCPRNCSLIHY